MWFCKPRKVEDEEETWEKAKIRRENRMRNKELALARLEWEKEINRSFFRQTDPPEQTEGTSEMIGKEEQMDETQKEMPEISKGQDVAKCNTSEN